MRILALDVGEKNIGLALSDPLGLTAQALPTLIRRDQAQDLKEISSLIKKNDVGEVVVGLPLNLDGSEGKNAQRIKLFVEELKKETAVLLKLWDERLTTMQAQRIMLVADISRKKRKAKIDQLAAQLILQSYLDAKG
ncbi:MAG: Holliday junction resolvase RuvX [Candidatus Omnitrophota bacterium]